MSAPDCLWLLPVCVCYIQAAAQNSLVFELDVALSASVRPCVTRTRAIARACLSVRAAPMGCAFSSLAVTVFRSSQSGGSCSCISLARAAPIQLHCSPTSCLCCFPPSCLSLCLENCQPGLHNFVISSCCLPLLAPVLRHLLACNCDYVVCFASHAHSSSLQDCA